MTSIASPTRTALDVLRSPLTGSERSIAIRIASVRYLASDQYAATIAPVLVEPTSVEAFALMSVEERLALLVERFTVHRRAERRTRGLIGPAADRAERTIVARRHAINSAPESAASGAFDTEPQATARISRWSVSCGCSCGAMVPTGGPRPVVRYLDASHRQRAAA